MKLYELAQEMEAIHKLIADSDGEMPPEIETVLDGINMQIEGKVNGLVALYKDELSDGEALLKEAAVLQERARVKMSNAGRLKTWLKSQLEGMGIRKVDTIAGKVSLWSNSRPSITWDRHMDDLPRAYHRVAVSADLGIAYQVWKETGQLPDGFTVNLGTHLRIT